ncbi:MAG: hypothetical protein QXS90_01285 [Candidatus Diapherotrites archaeon]
MKIYNINTLMSEYEILSSFDYFIVARMHSVDKNYYEKISAIKTTNEKIIDHIDKDKLLFNYFILRNNQSEFIEVEVLLYNREEYEPHVFDQQKNYSEIHYGIIIDSEQSEEEFIEKIYNNAQKISQVLIESINNKVKIEQTQKRN